MTDHDGEASAQYPNSTPQPGKIEVRQMVSDTPEPDDDLSLSSVAMGADIFQLLGVSRAHTHTLNIL